MTLHHSEYLIYPLLLTLKTAGPFSERFLIADRCYLYPPNLMPPLIITDVGLLSWSDADALQQRIVAAAKAGATDDVLLFCEHPHVLTLGRNASQKNLLASENVLRQKNVELRETNRGGDITYHGPGQIVGYPILNLDPSAATFTGTSARSKKA